jgi:hypothetical protein
MTMCLIYLFAGSFLLSVKQMGGVDAVVTVPVPLM